MKQVNVLVLTGPDTSTQIGAAIDASQLVSASFHAYFGDVTAAGTMKIQASNDLDPQGPVSSFVPTHWADIPSATVATTLGAPQLITIQVLSYRWLRVVYTYTSGGSSTVTVNMFAISA
jgi:hypothetical protein